MENNNHNPNKWSFRIMCAGIIMVGMWIGMIVFFYGNTIEEMNYEGMTMQILICIFAASFVLFLILERILNCYNYGTCMVVLKVTFVCYISPLYSTLLKLRNIVNVIYS